ncbi:hypothetical protein KI387_018163, partial [Taxus chinensis]
TLPINDLIEMADGFAGVFPEHKYEIVKRLQDRKHICGMTGDGVNDVPTLKKVDIGIAMADATDAARSASDIVLTEPVLNVIISVVLTSRAIFQRKKNYTLGFMLIALIWRFDFSPLMVLVVAVLNDGTIMTISKDRVKPSQMPDSWKLKEIFATGNVLGTYLALTTVIFLKIVQDTDWFPNHFHVEPIKDDPYKIMAALYLQVSIISQALIFVTRSRIWSFLERPGFMLMCTFLIAQLVAFSTSKAYGREGREAEWARSQRSMSGLNTANPKSMIEKAMERAGYTELSEITEQAKRRAEIASLIKGRFHVDCGEKNPGDEDSYFKFLVQTKVLDSPVKSEPDEVPDLNEGSVWEENSGWSDAEDRGC